VTGAHRITIAGEDLQLLPQKALWWPARRSLLISDTHFGKTATFRQHGIPVSDHTLEEDLARLSDAVHSTTADRLVILGDLLHARRGRSPETLARVTHWREEHSSLHVELIRGNHDRSAGPPLDDWRIAILSDAHREGPFAFCHAPGEVEGAYVLCGHLHPKAIVNLGAGTLSKLPCLWIRPRWAVLPAFGSFIDSAPVAPEADDRVLAIADGQAHDVTPFLAVRRGRRFTSAASKAAGTGRPGTTA